MKLKKAETSKELGMVWRMVNILSGSHQPQRDKVLKTDVHTSASHSAKAGAFIGEYARASNAKTDAEHHRQKRLLRQWLKQSGTSPCLEFEKKHSLDELQRAL